METLQRYKNEGNREVCPKLVHNYNTLISLESCNLKTCIMDWKISAGTFNNNISFLSEHELIVRYKEIITFAVSNVMSLLHYICLFSLVQSFILCHFANEI